MNPIKRVPLVLSGGDNEVVIKVVDNDGEVGELQNIRQHLNRQDEQMHIQNSLILQLRRELDEAEAEACADAERSTHCLSLIDGSDQQKTCSSLKPAWHLLDTIGAETAAIDRAIAWRRRARDRKRKVLCLEAVRANRTGAGRFTCPNCRRLLHLCAGRLIPPGDR
jgi:hypothetical protein